MCVHIQHRHMYSKNRFFFLFTITAASSSLQCTSSNDSICPHLNFYFFCCGHVNGTLSVYILIGTLIKMEALGRLSELVGKWLKYIGRCVGYASTLIKDTYNDDMHKWKMCRCWIKVVDGYFHHEETRLGNSTNKKLDVPIYQILWWPSRKKFLMKRKYYLWDKFVCRLLLTACKYHDKVCQLIRVE